MTQDARMSAETNHIVLTRPGFAELAQEELQARWGLESQLADRATLLLADKAKLPDWRQTVFVRQVLPLAMAIDSVDLEAAVAAILKRLDIVAGRPNRQKGRWTLHVYSLDDDAAVQRAIKLEKLLVTQLKATLNRFFKRHIDADTLADNAAASDFVVQVYLPNTHRIWLSVANAADVSLHVGGNLRMRDRDGAPSRSARKLEEAFVHMRVTPKDGETAVDLGAAPGGWTFALARHGATVTAVDNAELDLPDTKQFQSRVQHLRENGLKFEPPVPVDWLCCDMVIAPSETLRVLERWLDRGLMSKFVVNLKLPDAQPWPDVEAALALLDRYPWRYRSAKHLYHDRREITLCGIR